MPFRIMHKLLLAIAVFAASPISLAVADDTAGKPAQTEDVGARLVPVLQDGKPVGLKVYAIKPASRFAAAKFENGDTILSIDSESVVTEKGGALLRDRVIHGNAAATVELQRKGQRMTLKVPAKQ